MLQGSCFVCTCKLTLDALEDVHRRPSVPAHMHQLTSVPVQLPFRKSQAPECRVIFCCSPKGLRHLAPLFLAGGCDCRSMVQLGHLNSVSNVAVRQLPNKMAQRVDAPKFPRCNSSTHVTSQQDLETGS
eukprot:774629-Amphidinium_carterae.1